MTNFQFFHTSKGEIMAVECLGHAGYAYHGEDVVCSAISAITQSVVLGLQKVVNINISYTVNKKTGECVIKLPSNLEHCPMQKAQVLLKTMLISLKDLEKQYPKYIKVKESNYVY